MGDDQADLIAKLTQIEGHLHDLTSNRKAFIRGVINGIGIAVGTTVVAAIAFSVIGQIISSVDVVSFLQSILN